MKCVKRKLKSTSGASIIIALLFFLICCTVGVSVLAASKANAARMVSQRENERVYLAVRSEAQLIRDDLEKSQTPFLESVQEGEDALPYWTRLTSNPTKSLWHEIENGIEPMIKIGASASNSKYVIKAAEMPDVSVEVVMERTDETNFTFKAWLSVEGDYEYHMTLIESGAVRCDEAFETIGEGEEAYTRTTRTYTTNFSNGYMKKGKA